MQQYEPKKIEPKWQKFWDKAEIYKAEDFSKKPKLYLLVEFPYTSGAGLHVGHCRSYTAMDVVARKRRMEGFNVLYPMGWDAFGLPTENYAIKTGIHPKKVTEENTKTFKAQEKSLGFSFDWSREINTTDPKYYKWTQWIFLKIFEKGLAYKAKMPINWCLSCKIGLANEEVVEGKCERCGGEVVKKEKEQWMLKITKYADRLLEDLKLVDYPERVKKLQENWIGKSEGLEEEWQVEGMNLKLKTFTTWPHTSWGATFMVIAPEHPIINKLVKGTKYEKPAKAFAQKVIKEKIKDPLNVEKKKEGFFLGRYVINHLNGRRMPLYIANFAVYEYGTGIVKCTPTHDQRDFEFAKKYDLDFLPVIYPKGGKPFEAAKMEEAYTGEGLMMNAKQFNDMSTGKARKAIAEYTIKQGNGKRAVNYKLRDWVFSRQHYWGEPIPLVFCQKCDWQGVLEKDLPVELPNIKDYKPTQKGESPLAAVKNWVSTKCPKCNGKAERETDVMPNWAGSNWYFLRYCDPVNDKELASKEKLRYWMAPALPKPQGGVGGPARRSFSVGGVDWYNGGMEHTTLHLLYSRFVYKFLWDIGAVPKELGPEPYKKRTSHGMILAEGGEKMSKSKNNVVNPEEVIKKHGADTLRIYEMFMGPFSQAIAWDTKGVRGVKRFLEKVWKLADKFFTSLAKEGSADLKKQLHKTIKKVSADIEKLKFNTAVSALMEFSNAWQQDKKGLSKEDFKKFVMILSPFAPHLAEELWQKLTQKTFKDYKKEDSVFSQEWPKYDEKLIEEERVTLIVQVNGRVRDRIEVERGISEDRARDIALQSPRIRDWVLDKEVKRTVFIQDKLINIVV